MDLVLVLFIVAVIFFMSGFLLGMFLGDKYFIIDTKKHEPIPKAEGKLKDIDIIA